MVVLRGPLREYLPHRIEPVQENSRGSRPHLALDLGREPRYGTQPGVGADEKLVVMPIEDRAHVEKIRGGLGLFPLSRYLDSFEEQNGGRILEFLEWE